MKVIKKLFLFFRSLFFVKRCLSCECIIPTGYICERCGEAYLSEISEGCRGCGKAFPFCRCGVRYLPSEELIYTIPYKSEDSVARDLILACKRKRYKEIFCELSARMAEALRLNGVGGRYRITYIPRSGMRAVKTGVDQARELAVRLGKETGLPVHSLFVCRETHIQQKSLSVRQREAHARRRFRLKRGAKKRIFGQKIILVDDVVTSGASMKRCAELLYEGGADEVVCISAARSVKYL